MAEAGSTGAFSYVPRLYFTSNNFLSDEDILDESKKSPVTIVTGDN